MWLCPSVTCPDSGLQWGQSEPNHQSFSGEADSMSVAVLRFLGPPADAWAPAQLVASANICLVE